MQNRIGNFICLSNRHLSKYSIHKVSLLGTSFILCFSLPLSSCSAPTVQRPSPSASLIQASASSSPLAQASNSPATQATVSPNSTASIMPPLVLPSSPSSGPSASPQQNNLPAQITSLSKIEGQPGAQVAVYGQNLSQIEKIVINGVIAEIISREADKVIFVLPLVNAGSRQIEFYAKDIKFAQFDFKMVAIPSTGGGGGGGAPANPNPGPILPSPIKDSDLVTELPVTSAPPSLSDFVPVVDPEQRQGQARESVPSRNLSTTVLIPSAIESLDGTSNNTFQQPLVVGLGLNVEDDSFRVQTAFYSSLDPVFAYQGGTLPANIDLRANDSAIRSQGSRGTCTFHAWAGLMDYLLRQANRYQGPTSGLSPQFLSWLYQEEVGRYQTMDQAPIYGQVRVQFYIHTDNNFGNPNSFVLLETHFFPNDSNLQTNIEQAKNTFLNSSALRNWVQQGVNRYGWLWEAIQTGTVETVSEGSNIERVGELIDSNSPAVFRDNFGFTSNQGTLAEGFAPYPVPNATPIPASASIGSRQQRAQNILGITLTQSLASHPVPVQKLRTYRITNQTNSLKAVLSQGKPLVIGMPTFVTSATADFAQDPSASPWNMLNRTSLENATIDYKPSSNITSDGAHAVLLVGYRDQVSAPGGGYFIVRNSWGTAWGYQGYALISYDYIQKYAYSYPMTADLVPYNLQSSIDINETGSQMLLELTNVPNGTQQLAMEIKATNLDPLLSVTPYRSVGQLAHQYRINVPPGTGRSITVSAYGSANQLLGKAQLINQSLNSNEKKVLTLNFQPVNNPPVIQPLTSLPASLAGAGHTARLSCSATDPENNSLSYSWSTVGGTFGSFSTSTSAQTYWTAPNPANSSYVVRCSVNDGSVSVSQDYSISIANGNANLNGSGGFH